MYDDSQVINLLLMGKSIQNIPIKNIDKFNSMCGTLGMEEIKYSLPTGKWLFPEIYSAIDVDAFILEKCQNEISTDRAKKELAQYKEKGLYPMLQCLMYIVDTFRKNKIVWGVGRGSSVSSYVLFLIGVHKIDSLKYNLDFEDFLK